MEENKNTSYNSYQEEEEKNTWLPVIIKAWNIFIAHWPWFLLSVIVCTFLAYLYQAQLPRIYQRTSTILIKDDSGKGKYRGTQNSNIDALMALNGISVGNNLQNEIFVLQSHRLLSKVVHELNLNVSYQVNEGLQTVSLYKESPIKVTFFAEADDPQVFDIEIKSAESYRIHDIKIDDEAVSYDKAAKFGQPIKTPMGAIIVEKNNETFADYLKSTIKVTHRNEVDATLHFGKNIKASLADKESTLINIECRDTNAERADDILACLLEMYKKDIIDDKNRMATSADRFLNQRIQLIGSDLSSAENQMATFKENNKILNFDSNAELFLKQSDNARNNSIQLQSEKNVAEFLRDYLRQTDGKYEAVPSLGIINNQGITDNIAKYNELVLAYNRLSKNASEASPVVRETLDQLKTMHTVISKSLDSHIEATDLKLKQALAIEKGLLSSISSVPQKEKSASEIERQRMIKESIYVYLLNKREEVALQLAVTEANVTTVDTPFGKALPVSPKSIYILFGGFILGLLIPSAIFWLRITIDTKIRNRKEIEDACSVPILGVIPFWKEEEEQNKFLSRGHGGMNFNSVSEAFRLVRYNLNFMKKRSGVMMFTSSTPGQGKSFVSRNLALILGVAGKRVILIDGDIRKRTQSKLISSTGGLTAYLSDDTTDLDSIILHDSIGKNVDFLPAGMTPPNPTELLMSSRLEELTDELKARYDYVIYDSTPAFSVADAGIINRVVELTIYVVRIGVEDRRSLPDIERMYKEKKFRNMCIVVNGSVPDKYGYGYGYGYGHGYGYGYGYGDSRESRQGSRFSLRFLKKNGNSDDYDESGKNSRRGENKRIDVNSLHKANKDSDK